MNRPPCIPPGLVIRASAGTGKTYRLTRQLLQLLLAGAAPESILATTFTRKAAGEVLVRLLAELARAATDEAALQRLQAMVDPMPIDADRAADLLHRLARGIGRLRICTLDSFFGQIARAFAMELRLPAGWRPADEVEEAMLVERAVDQTISAMPPAELTTLLHLLGKGETRRSVRRELAGVVALGYHLLRRSDAAAWSSLAVPPMPPQDEITAALGVLENAQIGHKSADKNLRKLAADYTAGAVDTVVAHTAICSACDGDGRYYRKALDEVTLQACRTIGAAARAQLLAQLRAQTEATYKVLAAFDREAEALKAGLRVMSFDDVAYRLATWLGGQSHRTAGQASLAFRLDAKIDHLLLDEFQDTAPLQWDVLRPIARHTTGRADRSFFCVGDAKQAIYGWRGGKAAIFSAVESELPDVQSDPMDQSFRSSPVVVETVNRIFAGAPRHPKLETLEPAVRAFCREFPKHSTARTDLPGYACLRTGPRSEGNKEAQDLAHATFVARYVAELVSSAPGHTVGVLTRTNATVGRLIYLIRETGTLCSQEGGNPLTDSAAVELVLSAMMLADHPADARWWFHLAHSPLGPLLELEQHYDRAAVHEASRRLRRRLEEEGLVATVRWLSDALAPACDSRDLTRLRQLIRLAIRFAERPVVRWTDFAQQVRGQRVALPREAPVRVMTVHQAKGLEFDAVVLPELDSELVRPAIGCVEDAEDPMSRPAGVLRYVNRSVRYALPSRWQRAFEQHEFSQTTEAMCLLYVALTRPRHALHMLVQPTAKPEATNKTAAALVMHALEVSDPSRPETLLAEFGEEQWAARAGRKSVAAEEPPSPAAGAAPQLRLRPVGETPRRGWLRHA